MFIKLPIPLFAVPYKVSWCVFFSMFSFLPFSYFFYRYFQEKIRKSESVDSRRWLLLLNYTHTKFFKYNIFITRFLSRKLNHILLILIDRFSSIQLQWISVNRLILFYDSSICSIYELIFLFFIFLHSET